MATANDIINIARGELGYTESPRGSNRTKYGKWYGLDGQPWCMMFCQWVCHQAGIEPPTRTASCGALLSAARRAGQAVQGKYRPGDLLIFDFDRNGSTDHCGFVESVDGDTLTTIEGNTGAGNDANGGQVQRRTRSVSLVVGAWRPPFAVQRAPMTKGRAVELLRTKAGLSAATITFLDSYRYGDDLLIKLGQAME